MNDWYTHMFETIVVSYLQKEIDENQVHKLFEILCFAISFKQPWKRTSYTLKFQASIANIDLPNRCEECIQDLPDDPDFPTDLLNEYKEMYLNILNNYYYNPGPWLPSWQCFEQLKTLFFGIVEGKGREEIIKEVDAKTEQWEEQKQKSISSGVEDYIVDLDYYEQEKKFIPANDVLGVNIKKIMGS